MSKEVKLLPVPCDYCQTSGKDPNKLNSQCPYCTDGYVIKYVPVTEKEKQN